MAGNKKTPAPAKPANSNSLLDLLKAGTADPSSPEFQAAIAQVIEFINGAVHFEPKIS